MRHTATLRVECASTAEAETARLSLAPDNGGHLRARVEGTVLVMEAESEAMRGLLRSLDDALACLRAAGLP